MSAHLASRVAVLRDEVLDAAELSAGSSPGAEVFDAVLRSLTALGQTSPGLELSLHDTLARRLAWGESEAAILADADAVCTRLIAAAERSFRDRRDQMTVAAAAASVASTAARFIALGAVGRAARDRLAERRERLVHARLEDALGSQERRVAAARAQDEDEDDDDGS